MEGVKSIFGWVLLAMAAYFLRTVIPRPAGDWLLPAVLVVAALGLAFAGVKLRPPARAAAAVVFLAAAVFFVPRAVPAAATPAWRPYAEAAIRAPAARRSSISARPGALLAASWTRRRSRIPVCARPSSGARSSRRT